MDVSPEFLTGEFVTAAARNGDPDAMAIIDTVGWWLARGIANLATILDPTRAVLGGGLSGVVDLFLTVIDRTLPGLLEGGSAHPGISLRSAFFGETAGAVGASLIAQGDP